MSFYKKKPLHRHSGFSYNPGTTSFIPFAPLLIFYILL
nr:MAG TPA: hypothetical protein [Caudoviricetes sp.]